MDWKIVLGQTYRKLNRCKFVDMHTVNLQSTDMLKITTKDDCTKDTGKFNMNLKNIFLFLSTIIINIIV